MNALVLWKYEAVGNDFLIVNDWPRARRFDAALAAFVCDRHRGVGADGLIRVSSPTGDGSLRMDLLNADGSFAETSGNGLRCALLFARDQGLVRTGPVLVETAAGDVACEIHAAQGDEEATIRVAMGVVTIEEETASPVPGRRAFRADVGNPHLVLIGPTTDGIDLAVVGPELSRAVPAGRNVELVALGPKQDELDLRVFERGAGLTLACGSGSAAAAAAAHDVGLVGREVIVHNPGGDLLVELAALDGGYSASLVGSARRVGEVRFTDDDLVRSLEEPS